MLLQRQRDRSGIRQHDITRSAYGAHNVYGVALLALTEEAAACTAARDTADGRKAKEQGDAQRQRPHASSATAKAARERQ